MIGYSSGEERYLPGIDTSNGDMPRGDKPKRSFKALFM